MEVRKPERPSLRYFGGKWRLAPWIIENMPPHRVYVEPFGGAASVLLRKPRSYAEVYNDLDGDIVEFFRVLRCPRRSVKLERALRLTPFARDEFNSSYAGGRDSVDRARRLIIRAFMGFGSDGHNRSANRTGFRANSNRSGTTPAHDWVNFPDEIQAFCARLMGVTIEKRDAKTVMLSHDSTETLHFLDPPYVQATRSKKHQYRHEMNDSQHAELIAAIQRLKGMVMLCGYDSPVYDQLGWHQVRCEAHADGARDRIEVLWMNPACLKAQTQQSLF